MIPFATLRRRNLPGKVHPRARKNAIVGEVGDALKLALTAPPLEGRANEACIAFFAELLNVPRSSVTIAAGQSSRNKVIRTRRHEGRRGGSQLRPILEEAYGQALLRSERPIDFLRMVCVNARLQGCAPPPIAAVLQSEAWVHCAGCLNWPLTMTTTHDPDPALARHPHRLRTALLGREHQRAVRAALLLRGLRLAGALPARDSAISRRAGVRPSPASSADWSGFSRSSAARSPIAWASAALSRWPT